MQYALALVNQRLDLIETFVGLAPVLRFFPGAKPANVAAGNSGSPLATLELPDDWLLPASGGMKSKSGSWEDVQADADGIAGHWRIYRAGGTVCCLQGTVGLSQPADMILSDLNFHLGQEITVSGFVITGGNL